METDPVVMRDLGGPVPLGEENGGYRGAKLRVNHWVLTLRDLMR